MMGVVERDLLKEACKKDAWNYKNIQWEELPEDFWTLMDRGATLGLFQVEEGMARSIAKRLRPRSILDLAAIISLNRPGPLRSGVVERFLARRAGDEPVVFPHPCLDTILQETYGDFLYQEQVIAYFREIGYDLKEADSIRKMLGKKLVAEMDAEMPRYLERATKIMEAEVAQGIWDNIVDFSKYSFNKSHAVGYALILARTMYAKWKYGSEFIMSCIQTNPDRVGDYVMEGKRIDVPIHAPDVNHSLPLIANIDGTIWFGLSDVKGVGEVAAQWIVDHKPYKSYDDFVEVLEFASSVWRSSPAQHREARSPKQLVPAHMIKNLLRAGAFDTIHEREVSLEDQIEAEQELLGVVLTDTTQEIIDYHKDMLEGLSGLEALDDPANFDGVVVVPGIIVGLRDTVTKKGRNPGQKMGFVKIEWEGLEEEFTVFPQQWEGYKFMLKPRTVGVWHIKTTEKGKNLEQARKLVVE